MNWLDDLVIFPYGLSALISAVIGYYAYQRKSQPGAAYFAYLSFFEAVWTTGYILQELTQNLGGKLFWNNVQFIGAVAVPVAYCAFSFAYTGRTFPRPRLARRALLTLAAALLLIIWTDSLHHWFRIEPHLAPGSQFTNLVYANGPLFNAYTIFAYALIIFGTYALADNYVSAPRVFRLQVSTVLIGILIPWLTSIVTWLGLVPANLQDTTPLAFGISNVIVAWALFRYRLFDLVPVAHATLVESMEDGVIVLDEDLRVVDMNLGAQRVLDVQLTRVLGQPFQQAAPAFQRSVPELGRPGPLKRELLLSVNGELHYFEAGISDLYDNRRASSGRLVLLRDITDRKVAEEKLRQLAITDPLTGIFNRRHFFNLAQRELERTRRAGGLLSIILFDIDHFKAVNDAYGHIAGDQVLQTVTQRCLNILRTYDVMARYGGEEFIILLPETNLEHATQVAERLRATIAELPFSNIKAGPAIVTASLGVACFTGQRELTLDQLVDFADQAMYEAKQGGRNRVALSDQV